MNEFDGILLRTYFPAFHGVSSRLPKLLQYVCGRGGATSTSASSAEMAGSDEAGGCIVHSP